MNSVHTMLAGFAKVDMTPDYPVSLSGYGNDETRISQSVLDPIYMTCLAITSGADTVLILISDTLSISKELGQTLRGPITEATGVPGSHIFFSATHSHSGPLVYGDYTNVSRFRKDFFAAALEAAKAAMADRCEAQMLTGKKRVPGMNFIRHYLVADGTFSGANFGDATPGVVGHAGMSDPNMLLMHLKREEKPDIVMMNWQAHNDNVGDLGQGVISSSYTGQVRLRFEELTGMHFAFLGGATGNQARSTKVKEESNGLSWSQYGYRLAEIGAGMLENLKPVEGGAIKTTRLSFPGKVDHNWDHMVPQAQEVYDLWKATNKKDADALGKTYGFTSTYQTCAILHRAGLGETEELELNAFTIGNIAFITGTFEMYSDTGIYVRSYAPYDTVFICTGNNTYVPAATSYDYRSYEADTSIFAKGTCEQVSRAYVRMLEELAKA